MNRLECVGKASSGPQQQLAANVSSSNAETPKPNENMGEGTVAHNPNRSLPTQAPPPSVQVSSQDVHKPGCASGGVLDRDACSPKESINIRVEEELKMKCTRKAPRTDSTLTGGTTHSPQPNEPLPTHEEEQTEEEDDEEEEIKAPLELMIEFLRALKDRDYKLLRELCQMVLIYEPDNAVVSDFLPIIQLKLLDDQVAEQSTEDDDDSDDSGSEEESSQCSSRSSSSRSSSSSPSDDDDDEDKEKQVNRHSRVLLTYPPKEATLRTVTKYL